ncbi:phosphoribosyl pyrophosphate synthase-associated protein 2 isoform X3 [Harpegnathos saltator]|uniref:phosphoribosyl pyrophosphate synthase-associated protein 2 isoform X3 n=1 Tax=Harpegnathos saltator TaxID=610380 RepID=UPI00058AFB07|nr:phosphoribosyl pyrophosphate synthase-associated protein 2 isoform X3 [Harpegnathos saltator]
MDKPVSSDIVIIAGNSHPELANLIANRLGVKHGGCAVYHKSNRETMVEIGDSVRGKDLYIIQTGTKDVNNNIMELLIMAYACKTSSAKNIVGVIPYLPYSKQCKMRKRGCIVSKLLAKMLCKSGLTHIITMDLHQKEIQGFFDVPVDNLRASPFLLQYIQESIPDYHNSVIVARNPGSAKKATSYAERLRLGIAVIHGEQREAESDMNDGRYSPPALALASRTMEVGVGVPMHPAKEKPPINVVGDVGGRIAIMVVVVTNTVPHDVQKMQCPKIKTVDISILLAEAIRRIHNKESMSYLFKNVTLED